MVTPTKESLYEELYFDVRERKWHEDGEICVERSQNYENCMSENTINMGYMRVFKKS
jgi:hypothetical protein